MQRFLVFCLGIACAVPWFSDLTASDIDDVPALLPAREADFSLESLVFANDTTWAFWLNGVYIDSSDEENSWLKRNGLRILKVEEDGILLGLSGKKDHAIFLKPNRHPEESQKSQNREKVSKTRDNAPLEEKETTKPSILGF